MTTGQLAAVVGLVVFLVLVCLDEALRYGRNRRN